MMALWPDAPNTGLFSFGCNSRTRADRAAKELGYVAKAPTFWDTFEGDLMDAFARGTAKQLTSAKTLIYAIFNLHSFLPHFAFPI